MNEFISAFGSITVERLIVYIFSIFFIVKYARIGYQKITVFHDREQEKESIRNLVKENSRQIQETAKQLEELKNLMLESKEKDREYKLRSLSDKLFVCYNQAHNQGYITRRQLENFIANLNVYYDLGGNGLVEKKYEPEIMLMEIHED